MKTYWDLSERERAELSAEQVESFVGVELMTKGVLGAKPLELLPVPTAPEPDTKLYTLPGLGSSIYFKSEEDAALVASLIVQSSRKYLVEGRWSGPTVLVVGESKPDRTVQTEGAYSVGTYAAALDALSKAAAATSENEERSKRHADETKAREDALSSMWNDWQTCRSKATRLQRIRETFEEYVKLSDGDQDTAARFLAKAFPRPDIEEACEWFGLTITADKPDEAAA